MNRVSPQRIALLALQVSVLLGLCIGVSALLLPLAHVAAVLTLALSLLAGYALFGGYVGLAGLYLTLHHRRMERGPAVMAAAAVLLFALVWGGSFVQGGNGLVRETRAILSTFETEKGLLARLCIANAVREGYRRGRSRAIGRDACASGEDYLRHIPVLRDAGMPEAKLVRRLEANYRSVTCF
ncbi:MULTISPECIES: hypothetical protein [unclassified Desulfovibrio]|uniref:hypothetical protein n=1 Tax=unclassified Desulfovibrio TaxID=2593640 RepID=UPI0013ED050C|nr:MULTISPECIES: hypothetical protein [unclassified Desulfovibrio]